MDDDNTGFISRENMVNMMGKEANDADIDEMMKEAGSGERGVNYESFAKLATSTLSNQRRRQMSSSMI